MDLVMGWGLGVRVLIRVLVFDSIVAIVEDSVGESVGR